MKKHILLIPATILSIGFVTTLAFAEEREANQQHNKDTSTLHQDQENSQFQRGNRDNGQRMKNNDEQENEQEGDQGEIDNEGLHQEESGLRDELGKLPDIKLALSLREVNASTTVTYADVISLLTEYNKALDTLTSPLTLGSTTLSTQEQQLFNSLKTKNAFELGRTSARVTELRSQINDLLSLLTPLGTQTISDVGGLKKVLLSAVNDIRGAILDATDLHDKSNDILYEENS